MSRKPERFSHYLTTEERILIALQRGLQRAALTYETHPAPLVPDDLSNQPPSLVDYNLFITDRALREAVAREGAAWACAQLEEFGQKMGSAEVINWGFLANQYPPVLHTHSPQGGRRDEVEFHPAWHNLLRLAVEYRLHNLPWASGRPAAHVARAALAFLAGQTEAGHLCPISMTYSAVPVLRRNELLAREWETRIHSTCYDPSFRPASDKSGVLLGMAMTEKQGGSDVRANITHAEPIGNGEYLLHGHKWFCSAPMCDAFLVLAQAPAGLGCFFLPRWTPDRRSNAFHLQRLKPKLGNRSNASSEVEFQGAWARLIGEEGRGIATILEMVHHTRFDCVMASAALMRRALVEAVHHCRRRRVFGRLLIDQPLMRNVIADLALESEAATLLTMRLSRALDQQDRTFARLGVAAAKYTICKRAPAHMAEALECLGGNGYVEDSILPRLYREAPLNGIWEGSGNVIAIDVLRTIQKEPAALDALLTEIRLARHSGIQTFISHLPPTFDERGARRLATSLALALEASLLVRFSPPAFADAFCASRLTGDAPATFGTLPPTVDLDTVIASLDL